MIIAIAAIASWTVSVSIVVSAIRVLIVSTGIGTWATWHSILVTITVHPSIFPYKWAGQALMPDFACWPIAAIAYGDG